MTTDLMKKLAAEIAEIAVLHGQFTLRSGRTSTYYLDKYLFSTRPRILKQLGQLFAERIPEDVDGKACTSGCKNSNTAPG